MKLPITMHKNQIVDAVRNNDFLILTAETGSGKSTQVAQYLAEYYDQIVVTEPRIMAAITLANRVAEEMGVEVGAEVGYRTGYDKCSSQDTKILYCTDGLQLVRTITEENGSNKERVLIIDEVHEWNINIEALIAWCKLMHDHWNTKVVIMSATMETEALKKFYDHGVVVLNIPGTLFEVTMEWRPSYSLVPTIIENINTGNNILVFVAGKSEINDVIKKISENTDKAAVLLPLHGELDWSEQKKCFMSYNVPKVVVATNVAQTSVTIPDINVVVDSGEAKVSIAENGIQGLFLKHISKADILQRKGRAGRTQKGKYYLCSDVPFEDRSDYMVPEIQRSILDRVVLQLAAAGLDAEKLEFFHQPENGAVLKAKKELVRLGALDTNSKITELGKKMVKMPVSVQLARMIVAADEYGVTEQVLIISAIVEMGTLLGKARIGNSNYTRQTTYSELTNEEKSDLLAELDIWQKINKMGFIDFDTLGIHKKNFFKIKNHIKKLKTALHGIVEMTNTGKREDIFRACLTGMVSNIFVGDGYDYEGEDGITRKIDRISCVNSCGICGSDIVIGTPRTIECKGRWGAKIRMNLLSFVSCIDKKLIEEFFPNQLEDATETSYDSDNDTVKIIKKKLFRGIEISSEKYYDRNHPDYAKLKAEYDEEVRRREEMASYYNQRSYYNPYGCYERSTYVEDTRQKSVKIDGVEFRVNYSYNGKASIYIDERTLFTTDVKNVTLDDGTTVYVQTYMSSKEEINIVALRNSVENKRVMRVRRDMKDVYARLKVETLSDVQVNARRIGKVELTRTNGGYGDDSIYAYGCISLKKNTVSFELLDDEEEAASRTREAIQYLFMKEVERLYPARSFSSQKGKKKKNLTPYEEGLRMEFQSLVRELVLDLTVDTVEENLEFLGDYFEEMSERIQKAS